jgi:hypothetical protein
MSEVQAQANATAMVLERDIGVKPLVTWGIHNTTLTNINVVFQGSRVSGLSVGDLESKVRKAIAANFKQEPKQLVVSLQWGQ